MPFIQTGNIKYFKFDSFTSEGLTHGVFTRKGGVSEGSLSSLNMGLTVGDQPENVFNNRKICFDVLGRDIKSLSDSWLVHSNQSYIYDLPRPADPITPPKVDIILTDNPDVSLFMRFADCTPLLFYDPKKRAIALAHAGWKGTVQHVGRATVKAMQDRYGSDPKDIIVTIGPAIGPEVYEVGDQVIEAVHKSFGAEAEFLLPIVGGATHFDLWAANKLSIYQAGVKRIEVAEICTGLNTQDWFSHRVEKGNTGRFGVLLTLGDSK